MKAAALVVRYDSGDLVSVASESAAPLIDMAKRIRAAGSHDGRGVLSGAVISTGASFPLYSFRVDGVARNAKARGRKREV